MPRRSALVFVSSILATLLAVIWIGSSVAGTPHADAKVAASSNSIEAVFLVLPPSFAWDELPPVTCSLVAPATQNNCYWLGTGCPPEAPFCRLVVGLSKCGCRENY
jgi:hypothetical protein